MNTRELIDYYANLLILQYVGKPKAYATIQNMAAQAVMPQTTVQEIVFPLLPTAGIFYVGWVQDPSITVGINWDSTANQIQIALRLLPGLSEVTVTGSPLDQPLLVKFDGHDPVAQSLFVDSSTLEHSGIPFTPTLTEVDLVLPLAVEAAFNLIPGTQIAVGAQLDIVGKYAGVSRSGRGISTFVTLTDEEYILFIQMVIGRNSAGSSLSDIDAFLQLFFPGEIFVYDTGLMRLGYFIANGVLSDAQLELFVGQGLLPKPMGVSIYPIIRSPVPGDLFGFRTYGAAAVNSSPFNTYGDYTMDTPWLSYAYTFSL